MVEFRRVPREAMAANHRRLAKPQPKTITANVRPVLDLGDTVYVFFRGRSFGIPPVAWRTGQRLLTLRMAAMTAAGDGYLTPETSPKYYAAMGALARLLWRSCRPVGLRLKVLRFFGLLKNPFQEATEAELVELTDFFLRRRMKSGVGLPAVNPPLSMIS